MNRGSRGYDLSHPLRHLRHTQSHARQAIPGSDTHRQPGRHHLPRRARARRGGPDRLRRHPANAQAARPLRHFEAHHQLPRAQRGASAPPNWPSACSPGPRWRWSPTPACRWFPTPATGWCGRPSKPASRWNRSRPFRRAGGARRFRPSHRRVSFRGLSAGQVRPARQGPGSPQRRTATLIFYEAPHRVLETLEAIAASARARGR